MLTRSLAQLAGVYKQVGVPAIKPILVQYPQKAQVFANTVLSFDFDMLIPAHVNAPIVPAKESFRRAFKFVLGDVTPA